METEGEDELVEDEPIEEHDFMVTGVMYEGRADVVRELLDAEDPPTTAFLAREPANPYSKNAVQVRIHDGRVIGYVPEWTEHIRARDIARHLDAGAKHRARIKRILTGSRAPIPIVVAEIFEADVVAEGAVTQAELPGEPVALLVMTYGPAAISVAAADSPRAVPRGTITHRPPLAARTPPASRSRGSYLIWLIVVGLLGALALLLLSNFGS